MSAFRWRKFSPIDRDFPIFELVDGDVTILDVTRTSEGGLEIAIHDGAVGRVLDLRALEVLLNEVRALLAEEEPI